jgi:aquaporin Z
MNPVPQPGPRYDLKAIKISAYLSELAGMALIIFNALTWACWNFGAGSPIVQLVPDRSLRIIFQALCIAVGAAIVVYSPIGTRAGGHLNPATTLGFWLLNKISTPDALIYILMQLLGAFIGAALVWFSFPDLAHSIRGGATALGPGVSPALGFGLELGMTFLLMLTILVTVNSAWMRWTGLIASTVFAVLFANAAKFTGASLNPARSLAPAALAMFWQNQWIYWFAPPLGAALAVLLYRQGIIGTGKSYCSKLYHPTDIPCHHARCGYYDPTYVDDFSRTRSR